MKAPSADPSQDTGRWGYRLAVSGAFAFVLASSLLLPERVASHFDATGAANGYLPRTAYLCVMLAVLALPVLATVLTAAALQRPDARINLPNREHWLAPERRALAVALVRRGMRQFCLLLLAFLCYAQFLVLRANQMSVPRLENTGFLAGLFVFLVAFVLWLQRFLRSFQRPG